MRLLPFSALVVLVAANALPAPVPTATGTPPSLSPDDIINQLTHLVESIDVHITIETLLDNQVR